LSFQAKRKIFITLDVALERGILLILRFTQNDNFPIMQEEYSTALPAPVFAFFLRENRVILRKEPAKTFPDQEVP
jgi:hypothetical protein